MQRDQYRKPIQAVQHKGRIMTEPEEFHDTLTEYFVKEWFDDFPDPLLGIDVTSSEIIVTSERAFKPAYSKTQIPTHLVNLI